MSEVSRATLRRLLGLSLRTATDLDAFILDYFPSVYRRFSSGMDRTQRENLLLTLAEPHEIVSALRASSSSDQLRQIDAALRSDSTASEQREPREQAEQRQSSERPEPQVGTAATEPPLLFLEYADQDEGILQALETHLLPAERGGRLRIFHRGRIPIGGEVQKEFGRRLAEAAVIVPLLSADLLGSAGFEPFLKEAKRHQSSGALIVPLIVRPVMWEHTTIAGLKALPTDGKPLSARTRASERDAELVSIAGSLLKQAQSVQVQSNLAADRATQAARDNTAPTARASVSSAEPLRGTAAPRGLPTSYILHLSDLHFSSPAQFGPFLQRLLADLDDIQGQVPAISGVVVSGDLTSKATAAEFNVCGRFLRDLGKILGIAGQQVVLVPGNHDGSWEQSRAAYAPDVREETAAPETEPASHELYMQRFEAFAGCYREIVGSPYPLDPSEQATLHPFPEQKLLFLGLNSAWQCDHLVAHRGRATINDPALSSALLSLRLEKKYEDWLKIAVFHHPVQSDGEDRIKNTGFLDRLTQAGFRLALHGHMHAAQQLQHAYDSTAEGRKLRVVGAGTFGAPTKEWRAGVPLQYQILCIGGSKVTVRSRCRTNPEGTWQADGRWRVGDDVRSFYEINL